VSLPSPEFRVTGKEDIAGKESRPTDILLRAWNDWRDLAVDLTIVQSKPVAWRSLRGSAETFLKDKGRRNFGKAPTPSSGWVWTSPLLLPLLPMVFGT